MRSRLSVLLPMAAAATFLLSGCVSQQSYDHTAESAKTLEARNQQLLRDKQALEQQRNQLQGRVAQLESENAQLASRIGDLDAASRGFQSELDRLNSMLQGINIALLDPEADLALRQLAEQYPDLIEYDPFTGMVRFKSDLTFASGSDTVNESARAALQQFAGILQRSASEFDIRIVGHTDSQPIGASRNRYMDNRDLSVNRSMSVARVLESFGVAGRRIETSGWGEYRPAVPNTPTGNTPQNRRVDIYLLPSTAGTGSADVAPEPAQPAPQRPSTPDYPMK